MLVCVRGKVMGVNMGIVRRRNPTRCCVTMEIVRAEVAKRAIGVA